MKKGCKWVGVLSHVAAILTAIASVVTLCVNVVERGEVDALQKEALILKAALSNALDSVNLFGDMIAAAGGYRVAYLRVLDKLLSPENIPDMSSYQAEHLLDSINIFAEHPASNQVIRTIMYENAIINFLISTI